MIILAYQIWACSSTVRSVFEKSDVTPLIAEVFRELGYEGTSFSHITLRTGLSKGSLYHFFPGGKAEMASQVIAHVNSWFEDNMFVPLASHEPRVAILGMWRAVLDYFHSGQRVCVIGAFALNETRDLFSDTIQSYFCRWIDALELALRRGGLDSIRSRILAEATVSGIQGGLVIARALGDNEVFVRTVQRLADEIGASFAAVDRP